MAWGSWGVSKNNTINKPKTLTMTKLNKKTPKPQLRQTAVISRCSICRKDKTEEDMYDKICCYSCWNEEMNNYLYRNDSFYNGL